MALELSSHLKSGTFSWKSVKEKRFLEVLTRLFLAKGERNFMNKTSSQ